MVFVEINLTKNGFGIVYELLKAEILELKILNIFGMVMVLPLKHQNTNLLYQKNLNV